MLPLAQCEQHGELFRRPDSMRQIGRHVEQLAGLHHARFACESDFALAGKNLDQRGLGGGVLGQLLTFRETK